MALIRIPSQARLPPARGSDDDGGTSQSQIRSARYSDGPPMQPSNHAPKPGLQVLELLGITLNKQELQLPYHNTQYFSPPTADFPRPQLILPSTGKDQRMKRRQKRPKRPKSIVAELFASADGPHNKRKADLVKFLEQLIGTHDSDVSFLLLCYGKESECHTFPVRIQNSVSDDTVVWETIRQRWYACRGHWRKYLPFFGLKDVKIVEISIAGQGLKGSRGSMLETTFVGQYRSDDSVAEEERVRKIIADYCAPEFPCSYDLSTGFVVCDAEYNHPYAECEETKWYRAQRRLSRIRMRSFLKLAFADPKTAKLNDLLDGQDVIYSHQELLSKLDIWHCPSLAELQFHALLVEEGWDFSLGHLGFPVTATVLCILVVAAKLIYGDWGTAWNVGCFLVSLATLSWMWANHCAA